MDLVKTGIVQHIRSYQVTPGGELLYCDVSDTFFRENKPVSSAVIAFFVWDGIIGYYQHRKTFLIDRSNTVLDSIDATIWPDSFNGTDFIVSTKKGQFRHLSLCALHNNKLTIIREIGGDYIVGKYIVRAGYLWHTQAHSKVKLLSLETGKYLWEIDLKDCYPNAAPDQLSVVQLIGIYENQLLISLSNKELVSLNIHSGQTLWKTENFANTHLPDWRNLSLFSFIYWTLEDGKLYQLDGNLYISVDIRTQKVEVLWRDPSAGNYLTIIHKTYTRDHVYFTASYNYSISPDCVGIFNRRTLKIATVTRVEGLTGSLNQPPQYAGDALYALDSGGTLHSFKIDNH